MRLRVRSVARHRTTSPPSATAVTANFSSTSYTIDSVKSFGHCVSGFTSDAGDLRSSPTIQGHEQTLAPGLFRLALKWDRTNNIPINGASGGLGNVDDWITGIDAVKPAGAEIVAIVEGDINVGGTFYPENGATPSDAANLVHYYNDNGGQHGGPIKYWIIGNEPEINGQKYDYQGRVLQDGRTYGDLWAELYAAMNVADPTIKIGGPATSSFSGRVVTNISQATNPGSPSQFWNDFLNTTRGGVGKVADLVDFVDWHSYGGGNFVTGGESTATILARVTNPNSELLNARAVVNAYASDGSRGTTMPMMVSEFNWAYKPDNGRADIRDAANTVDLDGRFHMAANTVFIAAFYLNILRQAGWGLMFGDLVGPLGMYLRNNGQGDNMAIGGVTKYFPHPGKPAGTPMPAYYGIGMWTGMGLFRRFGSNIVTVTGSPTNTQVMAATRGANQADVVIINRDETIVRNLTMTTTGIANGTSVDIWATNANQPWDPPQKIATKTVTSGTLTGVIVQPMTVMRLVIG